MIQRIQTIFLFLAAVLAGLLFLFPIATVEEALPGMLVDGELETQDSLAVMILNALAVLLLVGSIFLFGNRKLQLKLNSVSMLLLLVLPLLAFFLVRQELQATPELIVKAGAFLPAIAIAFLIIANRHIRKDQALVESADRLR